MPEIYKEDQGKISRVILVTVIMLGAVFALNQLHGFLGANAGPDRNLQGFIDEQGRIEGIGIDWRYLVHAPLIGLAALFAFRQFNRPKTADFLIDTENELKNKVTWPSRKEEVNATIVLVVAGRILSVFIFGVDQILRQCISFFYKGF